MESAWCMRVYNKIVSDIEVNIKHLLQNSLDEAYPQTLDGHCKENHNMMRYLHLSSGYVGKYEFALSFPSYLKNLFHSIKKQRNAGLLKT